MPYAVTILLRTCLNDFSGISAQAQAVSSRAEPAIHNCAQRRLIPAHAMIDSCCAAAIPRRFGA